MEKTFTVKSLARALQKEVEGLTYSKALEAVSKASGMSSYRAIKAGQEVPTVSGKRDESLQITIEDWQIGDGLEVEESKRCEYTARIKYFSNKTQSFAVEIVPSNFANEEGADKQNALAAWFEIDEGLPRVMLTNDLLQDQLLSVHATKNGLVVAELEASLTNSLNAELEEDHIPLVNGKFKHQNPQSVWVMEHKNYSEG